MSEENNIIVPGNPNQVDKRRFRLLPLTIENVDRAGIGEFLVDRKTGDFYIVDDDGTVRSRTTDLEKYVSETINTDINSISYMYNRNRRVYRLFFTDRGARIDTNIILDDSCKYFRVRDLADNGKYYVDKLTAIKEVGTLSNVLKDNQVYFVEFYNKRYEMISMLPFSAKAALTFEVHDDTGETAESIKIYTNKDKGYVGEDPDSLLVKVYAVYDDGSEKDITEYSTVSIDTSDVNFNEVGSYEIRATWIYDVDNVLSMETTKTFKIEYDRTMFISDMIVTPRKIVNLNDGSKEIKLRIIVYYDDGSSEDVTERSIVSNFDRTLFNESQTITVKLNAGTVNVWNQSYEIQVNDNGSSSPFVLYYTDDNLLKLDDSSRGSYAYPEDASFYRVREPNDLDYYYSNTYALMHHNSVYVSNTNHVLSESKNVIVEFYDNNHRLLDSDVYACKYKDAI